MIKRLLYLSGLAVISVVLNHTAGWGYTALFWWTDRYLPVHVPNFDQLGGVSYYTLRGIEQLVMFAVPGFLFVSGFFIAFAAGRNPTVEWNIVGTRVKNLVIPYLLWSILIIAGNIFLLNLNYSTGQVLKMMALGGAADPYYYIPLICQFYLFAPFLVPLAKNRWKPLLVMAALLEIVVLSLRYGQILGVSIPVLNQLPWITASWFFPGHAFWFPLGIVAGFHLQTLKQWLHQARWGLLAVLIITFVAGMIEWEYLLQQSGQEWIGTRRTLIDTLYAGAFLLSFLAFDQINWPFSKQFGNLGPKSFGVYLIHAPVLIYASKAIYHLAPWILAFPILLFQPILLILGVSVPLILMMLVKRSPIRGYYAYIFG